MTFSIWIVSRPNYVHSQAFDEVAIALASALKHLGHDACIVREPSELAPTTIVLGGHLLPSLADEMPRSRLILFNMEQVASARAMTAEYVSLLRAHTVWDYSQLNIVALRSLGVRALYCGLGYAPELSRIEPSDEDIDVLLYGSLNHRRRAILDELSGHGVRVVHLYGQYGQARDLMVARSKIALNVHFYGAQVFEIVRVSYLLANRRCVVSETGRDAELEGPYAGGLSFAAYDEIVDRCLSLLNDPGRRAAIGQAGFEHISAHPQTDYLKTVLKSSL